MNQFKVKEKLLRKQEKFKQLDNNSTIQQQYL